MNTIGTLVGMELRQRMRSRGWYILLAVFFVLTGLVTLGALGLFGLSGAEPQERTEAGRLMFDLVAFFVLLLSLLVSPALSANAITGDRAGGTLAIVQVTPVRTWQLILGKWIAAWIPSVAFLLAALPWLIVTLVFGGLPVSMLLLACLVLMVEFAVVTGLGVAVSAISGRTLFAVVVTYLLVALLGIGTLIGFGLGTQFTQTTVRANWKTYAYDAGADWDPDQAGECSGQIRDLEVSDLRRIGWALAPNPFVLMSDAVAPASRLVEDRDADMDSVMTLISSAVRSTQLSPEETTECVDGIPRPTGEELLVERGGLTPVWPLGLAVQAGLVAVLMLFGHRRLHTPAGRMPKGQRVA
jgi:ABC-2 type transport system permease protein